MTWSLWALLFVFLLGCRNAFMQESAFSCNVGQFPMSRSWLVSFVVDLGYYENVLVRLSQDIINVL